MKVQMNADTFSIVEITSEDLKILSRVISVSNLPDKRELFDLKKEIDTYAE